MERAAPDPNLLFLLTLYLPVTLFALGLLVGWLLGKSRRWQAVVALFVGGLLVFFGYAGMFAWIGVFDIKTEIR